ncbi:MAG: histidinol dehydrogenase [Ruminococcaceae bacterium]|nr:histidinol dehydrogenase [Oscillospiraceae bacterium]
MIKILKYGALPDSEIFARTVPGTTVAPAVEEILARVREEGDGAVKDYTARFDGATLASLEVTGEEIEEAFAQVEPKFITVLQRAAENIRKFHAMQKRTGFSYSEENGVIKGQKITPIENVGIYVPGGTAAYPSTVLMDTIPAKIAGCKQIVMVSPPGKDGKIAPAVLAAAKIAGVDRVFKMGGAQAIGALAYGTASVPKVDKIVGPGNAYVAEAKRQVFGLVSIDMIAGPSEILVIADGNSNPAHVAADLLSQAEHDRNAAAVLVTDSKELALAVQAEIEKQLKTLPREEIARVSIENNGKIILADSIESVIKVANTIAPEHLELMVEEPFAYLKDIENAGSVFMGRYCPEALGDYLAGPNHTLPTSGTARFSSPLSVDDFVKKSQFIYYTEEALASVADDVAYFARMEGLEAHARSAEIRNGGAQ